MTALETAEFYVGSESIEHEGAQSTVRINAEDFAVVLNALRVGAADKAQPSLSGEPLAAFRRELVGILQGSTQPNTVLIEP